MVMAAKVAGSATPLTSRLPKIDTSSPRVLEKAPPATARRHAKGGSSGLTTRQHRRPSPRHVKQAERQLWKADVKRWADNVGYDVSWGWDKREERVRTSSRRLARPRPAQLVPLCARARAHWH